jgi:hypothetical protein
MVCVLLGCVIDTTNQLIESGHCLPQVMAPGLVANAVQGLIA